MWQIACGQKGTVKSCVQQEASIFHAVVVTTALTSALNSLVKWPPQCRQNLAPCGFVMKPFIFSTKNNCLDARQLKWWSFFSFDEGQNASFLFGMTAHKCDIFRRSYNQSHSARVFVSCVLETIRSRQTRNYLLRRFQKWFQKMLCEHLGLASERGRNEGFFSPQSSTFFFLFFCKMKRTVRGQRQRGKLLELRKATDKLGQTSTLRCTQFFNSCIVEERVLLPALALQCQWGLQCINSCRNGFLQSSCKNLFKHPPRHLINLPLAGPN